MYLKEVKIIAITVKTVVNESITGDASGEIVTPNTADAMFGKLTNKR